jgi:hypothetical protein
MPRQTPPDRETDTLASQVGGAAAGLIGGLAVGFLLGVMLFFVGAEAAAGWVLFACIAGGTVAGYLSAAAGMSILEGVCHFVVGTASGISQYFPAPSDLAPRWLRWVLFAGVVFGFLVFGMRRW